MKKCWIVFKENSTGKYSYCVGHYECLDDDIAKVKEYATDVHIGTCGECVNFRNNSCWRNGYKDLDPNYVNYCGSFNLVKRCEQDKYETEHTTYNCRKCIHNNPWGFYAMACDWNLVHDKKCKSGSKYQERK